MFKHRWLSAANCTSEGPQIESRTFKTKVLYFAFETCKALLMEPLWYLELCFQAIRCRKDIDNVKTHFRLGLCFFGIHTTFWDAIASVFKKWLNFYLCKTVSKFTKPFVGKFQKIHLFAKIWKCYIMVHEWLNDWYFSSKCKFWMS